MIKIANIVKRFGDREVLSSANYHFPEGEKIAIVGANGAGKTTFLNILCQLDDQDAGNIEKPPRCKIGYLPQIPNQDPLPKVISECLSGKKDIYDLQIEVAKLAEELAQNQSPETIEKYTKLQSEFENKGGYAYEAQAHKILDGLGFDNVKKEQSPKELSGGWRMRLELAKIFMDEPNFLILDEPTNHLDLPSLVWVENYLREYSGTLVFVSHDRKLLNKLSTHTVELKEGKLKGYKGNFDAYLTQSELENQQLVAQVANIESQKKHLQKFVDRFGAKNTKATQAQSRVKMIKRLEAVQANINVQQAESSVHIHLPKPPHSGKNILHVKDLTIGYPNLTLTRNISFSLQKGSKVAIIGANGIGKSTLLKTIARRLTPIAGEVEYGHQVQISYFAQDHSELINFEDSIIDNILRDNSFVTEKEARNMLGSLLFHGDDVFKKVKVLSGGEKNRVGLVRCLATPANLMLLDEPTNHLDMLSCQILTEALDLYEGSLVFVSHDRDFINAIATHILAVLPDGRCQLFEGDIPDYVRLADKCGFPNVLEINQTKTQTQNQTDTDKSKRLDQRRQSKEKQKNIKKIEKKMEKLQKEIAATESELAETRTTNFQALQELSEKAALLKSELEKLELEWLELVD